MHPSIPGSDVVENSVEETNSFATRRTQASWRPGDAPSHIDWGTSGYYTLAPPLGYSESSYRASASESDFHDTSYHGQEQTTVQFGGQPTVRQPPQFEFVEKLTHTQGYQSTDGFSYPNVESQGSGHDHTAMNDMLHAFSTRSFTLNDAVNASSSQQTVEIPSASALSSGHESYENLQETNSSWSTGDVTPEIQLAAETRHNESVEKPDSPEDQPLSTDQKPSMRHYCHICPSSFPRPSGLQAHLRHHTGLRPFACPVLGCSKRFSVRSNAKRHLRTHGISTAPEPTHRPTPYLVGFDEPIVPNIQHEANGFPGPLTWVPENLRSCTEIDVWRHIRDSAGGPGPTRTIRHRRRSLTDSEWYSA